MVNQRADLVYYLQADILHITVLKIKDKPAWLFVYLFLQHLSHYQFFENSVVSQFCRNIQNLEFKFLLTKATEIFFKVDSV